MYTYSISNDIRNLTGAVSFRLPGGSQVLVDSTQENPFLEFSGEIVSRTEHTLELRMHVRNIGSTPLFIETLIPGLIDASNGGGTSLGDAVQSWTMLSGGLGNGVRDLCDFCFAQKARDFYASNYAMFGNREVGRYFLGGFKSSRKQDTRVELHAEVVNIKFKNLKFCCDLGGFELQVGASLASEVLTLMTGTNPTQLVTDFAGQLADLYGHRTFKNITGWSGWDYYQRSITEKEMLQNLNWLAAHRDTIPLEYIQLDDGYEIRDGDWLLTNDKFPHGLKYLVDRIHDAGFKAGLWVNPFLAAPEAEVIRNHPEWVLRDRAGKPVILNGYAVSDIYGLDCSVPGVTDYLKELAHALTVDLGFDYLKFDGANGQVLTSKSVPRNAAMGRGEAMRLGMESFRSGMRPGTVLLNCSSFGLSMGIADAQRVGEDTGGRWDASLIAKDHGERDRFNGPGEILRAIAATNNHFYLHGKVWTNDPDYLVVRQEGLNSELSLEEARSWATVIALSNGSIILADPPHLLSQERLDIVRKILPHCHYPARPVDFFRKSIPSILAMKATLQEEEYLVVSVTNTDCPKRPRNYTLDFAELGLEMDTEYLAFEFWSSTFMGIVQNKLEIRDLPPHATRLISLRKKQNGIQLIGTDSHVSMGEAEIESFDGKTLKIRRRGHAWRAFFFLPEKCAHPKALKRLSDGCCYLEMPPDEATLVLT